MLFKIFGLEITFGILFSFLFGIVMGLVIFFLIYLYALVRSLNKKKKVKLVTESDIDYLEITNLIKSYQNEHQKQAKTVGFMKSLVSTSRNLATDVARMYFPKSKYPYGEITIDEAFEVAHYVISKVNELLSAKIIRLFRKLTISKIISLSKTTKKVTSSEGLEGAKEVTKGALAIKKALNIINPVYWIKKLFVDTTIKITLNKIGLMVISVVGQESYKIYSKKLLNESDELDDASIDKIYEDIKRDLKNEEK